MDKEEKKMIEGYLQKMQEDFFFISDELEVPEYLEEDSEIVDAYQDYNDAISELSMALDEACSSLLFI